MSTHTTHFSAPNTVNCKNSIECRNNHTPAQPGLHLGAGDGGGARGGAGGGAGGKDMAILAQTGLLWEPLRLSTIVACVQCVPSIRHCLSARPSYLLLFL